MLLLVAFSLVPMKGRVGFATPLSIISAKARQHSAPKNQKALLFNPEKSPNFNPPKPHYGNPPPEGSVRPGEFEQMDGILIAAIGLGKPFMRMWTELIGVYTQGGFTWVIAGKNEQVTLSTMLSEKGVPDDNYAFLDYPVDSIWVRDYGPEFVVDPSGRRHIIDSYFLGAIAFWPRDDAIPIEIGRDDWINEDGSPMPVHSHLTPISGGNLMTDGAGTCFSSSTIYTVEKPPNWKKRDVDRLMLDYFGCEQLIVLDPICLESTGHIDMFAKIVSETTILLGEFEPDTYFNGEEYSGPTETCRTQYPNDWLTLENNQIRLESTTNVDGESWEIIRVPMPEPYWEEGAWVYRSYLNAQIFNDRIAMPSYRIPKQGETIEDLRRLESEAVGAYAQALPDHILSPIQSDHIIPFGGAIHCISHEIPAENLEDPDPDELLVEPWPNDPDSEEESDQLDGESLGGDDAENAEEELEPANGEEDKSVSTE